MRTRRTTLKKWVSVLFAPGTQCEEETMAAIRLAGGDPHLLFLWDVYHGKVAIDACDNLYLPGGFSLSDYPETGVGVATFLEDQWGKVKEARIPTIGICNGDQIAVCAGLLGPGIAMVQNACRTFVSRPCFHRVAPSNCVWTK